MNIGELKQQLELVDIASDSALEEDAKLLHDLGTLLDKIIGGEIVLFYKDINGTPE